MGWLWWVFRGVIVGGIGVYTVYYQTDAGTVEWWEYCEYEQMQLGGCTYGQ
jgi:hypothetical protein